MSSLGDLAVNLLASVIAGLAVWFTQRFRRRFREGRRRRFFGMTRSVGCTISVPRHAGSDVTGGVHRVDAAAMIEVAAIARDCGSDVESLVTSEVTSFPHGLGERTEFCVGGPDANQRAATHLRTLVPGVRFDPFELVGPSVTLHTARRSFTRIEDVEEYVLLARIPTRGRPVFLICGQSAATNHVAARFLKTEYDGLRARFGTEGRFCLVIRVDFPADYGDGLRHEVADVSATAFDAHRPSEPSGHLDPTTRRSSKPEDTRDE